MNSPETPSTAPVAWCRSDDFRDAFLKRQSFNGWREKHSDCDMALYAQPQASPAPDADQVEGPSLDDVYELCQEFEFHLDECQGESAEILRDMITAAITRWRAYESVTQSGVIAAIISRLTANQPLPVNLAELRDPDFSDGLTPSQHLDVVHGGPDPRLTVETHEAYPAPLTIEPRQCPKIEFDRSLSVLDDRTPEEICGYGNV